MVGIVAPSTWPSSARTARCDFQIKSRFQRAVAGIRQADLAAGGSHQQGQAVSHGAGAGDQNMVETVVFLDVAD
jgi:hypothetical protein